MNPDVQAALETVYENPDNIPDTTSSQSLQSAMVVIDNVTGDVAGIVGGTGEKTGSLVLSRATQSLRSPGSTIKPITVFAPALEQGIITPATVFDDTPYSFGSSVQNQKGYPKNHDGIYRGCVSVDYAMRQSLNTVAIKIVDRIGPENSYKFAKEKMGLSTLVDGMEIAGSSYTDVGLAPLSMGGLTRGVSVREMTNAYAALANSGSYRYARTYSKVEDAKGIVILENKQERHTAMKSDTAWYVTHMMENTVKSGTASAAALGNNMAVAAKTGTTDNNHDRWFAGYTPYYTAVVWCGFDEPDEVVLTKTSTNPALSYWKSVMELLHQGKESRQFPQPSNVKNYKYCQDSGLLATDACRADPRGSREVSGLLFEKDAPKSYCTTHVMTSLCGETGYVATEYCYLTEENEMEQVGLLALDRAFPVYGIAVSDQMYVAPSSELGLADSYHSPVFSGDDRYSQFCPLHAEPEVPEEPLESEEPEIPEGPSVEITVPEIPQEPEITETPSEGNPIPQEPNIPESVPESGEIQSSDGDTEPIPEVITGE